MNLSLFERATNLSVSQLANSDAITLLGAVLYILVLTRVHLSVAAPSASMIYILSVLIGYFAFQETLSVNRLFGIGFIVCGILLVAWQR